MWKEIKLLIGGIKDKELRKLVSSIYKSNQKKLMVHPSSIKMNHSYRSGFLEHVLSMAKIAKKITHPLADSDVRSSLTNFLKAFVFKLS